MTKTRAARSGFFGKCNVHRAAIGGLEARLGARYDTDIRTAAPGVYESDGDRDLGDTEC
jgi:hypothetical protein